MEVDSLIRLHHLATNTTLPEKLRVRLVDDELIQLQVEDVEGGSSKQVEEEKDHYLRVVTRGGASSTVDFRGNVEEAETDETKFRVQYHEPHPAQLFDHPKVGVVETKSGTENMPNQQVIVSLQSRAMVGLISTVPSGHDTEHRASANGTFGPGNTSRTGALGTYLGFKGGSLIADAGLGPDSRFKVVPANKPAGPRVAGRLAHEQAAGEEHGAADNPGNLVYPNKNINTHTNPREGPQLKTGGQGMQPDVISPEA